MWCCVTITGAWKITNKHALFDPVRYRGEMIKQDQSAQVALLSDPAVFAAEFGDTGETVARVTTHASELFIGTTRVLKLKRAVEYPFMDYATVARRHTYCLAEVAVNRRTAPHMYLGVRAIVRGLDGDLRLGPLNHDPDGDEVIDWVVEMVRFDQDTLFDRLADKGRLDRPVMEHLADKIATFHAASEARQDGGGRTGIAMTIESNAKAFAENGPGFLDMERVAMLTERSLEAVNDSLVLLERRRLNGCVRHCHGDMHLRNIFLQGTEPVLFDAIEFNDAFSIIDVLYDLAFLLMDLDHRGLRSLANVTMNRYMDITGSAWGLSVLPLFLSVRAAVRAFVACAAANSVDDADFKARQGQQGAAYLDRALGYLEVPAPRLIAVGGLSGSGKSRLGRELARHIGAAPGARVVRSDVVRKRIAGLHPLDPLGPDGYSAEMTERTYRAVYEEAQAVLASGHSVIADCVFSKPSERQAIEDVAREMEVPFDGFWLTAPPEILQQRVQERENNPSDADVRVVKMQMDYDLGAIDWHAIDASKSRAETDAQALKKLDL